MCGMRCDRRCRVDASGALRRIGIGSVAAEERGGWWRLRRPPGHTRSLRQRQDRRRSYRHCGQVGVGVLAARTARADLCARRLARRCRGMPLPGGRRCRAAAVSIGATISRRTVTTRSPDARWT
jgi:hypothetical protein